MCGFVGTLGADLPRGALDRAAVLLAARGPDRTDRISVGPLDVVAHRLAIVPPLDAPSFARRGSHVTLLNGEVYDLPLEAGAPATDTERLANLSGDCAVLPLAGLRGLFAIVHWDGRRLTLARDRFGIKPLYWAKVGTGIAFASEMKALLSLPDVSRDPDLDVLDAHRVVGHNIFTGRTPFRCISCIPPGHAGTFAPGREPVIRPFASLPEPAPMGRGQWPNGGALEESVAGLLREAVERATNHDPTRKGLFLSGGIDSALLLALSPDPASLVCFTLSDRDDADDRLAAREVASAFGAPWIEHRVDEVVLSRELVHYSWHFEHPVCGGAFDLLGGVAFHSLARKAAETVRVALCGEGADELFLGYHRIHERPELAAGAIRSAAREVMLRPGLRDWIDSLPPDGTDELAVRMRSLALKEGLSDYHLPSVDRSGMAFGLEFRPPYLDEDVADLACRLDESALIDREGRWTKLPLRGVARHLFGPLGLERVAIRRKRAMPSAVERAGAVLEARIARELPDRAGGSGTLPALSWVMRELFWQLFVDPGLGAAPEFDLVDFARTISAEPQRWPA